MLMALATVKLRSNGNETAMLSWSALSLKGPTHYASTMVPRSDLCRLLPYHMVFNTDWTVLHTGDSISAICPAACTSGAPFAAHWRSLQPSLADLHTSFDGLWHLENKEVPSFQLRGRALRVGDLNHLWFVGTPILASSEEACKLGIPAAELKLCEFVAPTLAPPLSTKDPELRAAMEQLQEAQAKSQKLFDLLKTQNRELQEARDKALQAAQVRILLYAA